MKSVLIRVEFSLVLYLISLPLLMYCYGQGNVFFWIILAYVDGVAAYMIDYVTLVKAMKDATCVNQMKRLKIYMFAESLFIFIIAFKNLQLAFILIMNELVIAMISPLIQKMRKQRK
ncbi:MAG: hypothetical protein RR641_07120 [Erysipelotrichaceae bacterium]